VDPPEIRRKMFGFVKIFSEYESGLSDKVAGCFNRVSFHEGIISGSVT
jgi:hypothetical protein